MLRDEDVEQPCDTMKDCAETIPRIKEDLEKGWDLWDVDIETGVLNLQKQGQTKEIVLSEKEREYIDSVAQTLVAQEHEFPPELNPTMTFEQCTKSRKSRQGIRKKRGDRKVR